MRKTIRFQEEVHEYIQEYSNKNNCTYNKAVNTIILKYKEQQSLSETLSKLLHNQSIIYKLLKKV